MTSKRLLVFAGIGLGLIASDAGTAAPYPQRPVKIITAGLPGTPFDLLARAIADKLAPSFKQATRYTFVTGPIP